MKYRAGINGRDWIELELNGESCSIRASGCLGFLRSVARLRLKLKHVSDIHSADLAPLASTTVANHGDLLMREVLLRARGEWSLPYQEKELCHCRAIRTDVVDQAILTGAKTAERVAKLTSAGSACGTCRGDTEAIIKYRWG